MSKYAVILSILVLTGCSDPRKPVHPNVEYRGDGYVMIVDWGQRTFVVRQDDGTMTTFKSCEGQMPVWQRERLLIHSHRAWEDMLNRYEQCDHFDLVQQTGKDMR